MGEQRREREKKNWKLENRKGLFDGDDLAFCYFGPTSLPSGIGWFF
jgi:hypothetical protein